LKLSEIREKLVEIVETVSKEDELKNRTYNLLTKLEEFFQDLLLSRIDEKLAGMKVLDPREYRFAIADVQIIIEIRRSLENRPKVLVDVIPPSELKNEYYRVGIQDRSVLNNIVRIESIVRVLENTEELYEILNRTCEELKEKVARLEKTFEDLRKKAAKYLVAKNI